jgi:prepilin-type N-terminal cleavage/methylation domain-containing protein
MRPGFGAVWRRRAFTLMELVTVILIIGILLAMVLPAFSYMRSRAEGAKCAGNLRSLYVAASSYIQTNGQWPQIDPGTLNTPDYPDAWIKAFERFNISEQNWVCPSVQRILNNPDLTKRENRRIDYFATPFGDKRQMPYKFPKQPWFIERGDMHGDGQFILFPDGQVKTLREVLRDTQVQNLDITF